MGKSKKARKGLTSRDDPVGLDSAILELEKGLDLEFGSKGASSMVENILAQLQSTNPEDRICGCHSIASLASKQEVREELLKVKVARICGPLLQDSDQLVVQAAAGCLHNLSCEGVEVVEQLVEQDIITPLASLMGQFRILSKVVDEKRIRTIVDSLGLMWNMMEQSQIATDIFNRENLIDIVLQFLDTQRFPASLVQASLSLLATACDNNIAAQQKMTPHILTLSNLIGSDVTYNIRMISGVALLNILQSNIFSDPVFPSLISAVSGCLQTDTRKMVSDWSSTAPLEDNVEDMEVEAGKDDVAKDDKVGDECKKMIKAQFAALEILANLTSNEEGDEEFIDDDDDDFDGGVDDGSNNLSYTSDNPVLVEALVSNQLVQTILLRSNDLPSNVKLLLSTSKQGKSLLSLSKQLIIHSFLCLSNLTSCLSLSDLGGSDVLYQTWTGLGSICCQPEQDNDLKEAASSAMRSSTAKLCAQPQAHSLFNLGPADLDQLLAVFSSPEASIRTNIVSIMGDLAGLAARNLADATSCQVLSTLALWLVDTAAKDESLRVAAEAFDKLFDAFGEDDTDLLFAKLDLLQKLRNVLPQFKSRIGQNKKRLGEDLPIVIMARDNLQSFIQYKGNRLKK